MRKFGLFSGNFELKMRRGLKSCRDLPRNLSIDSSVILSYLLGEEQADLVEECILSSDREIYIPRTALAEIYYMICRLKGRDIARELLNSIRGSVIVVANDDLDEKAGDLKCSRSIYLADCYVIALAELIDGTAVFARREQEILKEIEKPSFNAGIVFLGI